MTAAVDSMASKLALIVVLCASPCAGAATHDIVQNRGGLRGNRHFRDQQVALAPLYDDFLDVMNNAASKALEEQRAIPAYDDFLHLMKHSAEKAYDEQAGAPSYDDFLGVMKGKTEEAYSQQKELPSYNDFLDAIKASTVEATKTPVPSYEDFLKVLKDGAESAMHKREHNQQLSGHVVDVPVDQVSTKDTIVQSQNPLDQVGKDMDKAERQMSGEKSEKGNEESRKLQRELKKLKAQAAKHKKENPNGAHKKPVMQRINVLRTQLCWQRPNLWQHEKCMRFLGIHCMKESTGEGICKAFAKKAKQKCETAKDGHFKDDYCALSEALDDNYGEDEEEEEEEEQEEELEDVDEGGESGIHSNDDLDELDEDLGSDEDLDDELVDEDKNMGLGDDEDKDDPDGDRDGDGVKNSEDAFADDPNEWADTDKDGIGDNADDDIDGDGHKNDVDVFPHDPKEWADTDKDGIGDNADKDRDNDGVANDKDKFPDDPTEWKDSDKDGVGDNADAYPFNPNCHSPILPCGNITKSGEPKKGSSFDPTTLDKNASRPLPDQGFNEHMTGPRVTHDNYYTYVGDWQEEFPEMPHSEKSTMDTICKEHPDNTWCQKFKHHDPHFR